jgi:hypothetical protein
MTLCETISKARRWEFFNHKKEDGSWELPFHVCINHRKELVGLGGSALAFSKDPYLLTSTDWEFVDTEEEYQRVKDDLDRHYKYEGE